MLVEERIEGIELETLLRFARKWWWLFVAAVVGASLVGYYLGRNDIPIYKATAKVLVEGRAGPDQLSSSDIDTSRQIARTYSDLVTARPVLQRVIDRLALPTSPEGLRDAISVQAVNTIIEITAKDANPGQAAQIATGTSQAFIDDFEERQLTQIARYQASLTQRGIAQDSSVLSAQARTLGALTLLEEALPPGRPIGSHTQRNMAVSAILGLMAAASVAYVLQQLDDGIGTAEDLKKTVRVAAGETGPQIVTLGSVTYLPSKTGVYPLISNSDSAGGDGAGTSLKETYQYVALNLEFSAIKLGNWKTILVTSALPGEGKSTTAINLAIALTLKGKSVILVDTDLLKPVIHRVFQLDSTQGVSTALLGKVTVAEALQPTNIERLRVLTSGPIPPDSTPVLRSPNSSAVFKALTEQADVVIFDSPPLLVTPDAMFLASLSDVVVVVADARKGRRSAFKRAVQRLGQANVGTVGLLLNKTTDRREGGHYYYYYRYKYREGASGDGSKDGKGARRHGRNGARLPFEILRRRK
jgi:capsular exopolysaccharide synthesis family protein